MHPSQNFPPNLVRFYNRVHAPIFWGQSSFLKQAATKPDAKKRFKKFQFLLGLPEEKATNWILENASQADFFGLLEGLVALSDDLSAVDALLANVPWDDELNHIRSYEDFTASDYARVCATAYNTDGESLPSDFREFESYVLSGASLEDIFFKKILPHAIRNDSSVSSLWHSKAELECFADLKFKNTAEGCEAIKQEHAKLKTKPATTLSEARGYTKRILELEFMFVFMVSIDNADAMKQQVEQTFQNRLMRARVSLTDREYTWILSVLYSMSSGTQLASSYHGPFSHCYFASLVLPVLREMQHKLA